MNIMVTGAAGMIGSHLIDYIFKNNFHNVIAVDNLSVGKLANIEKHLKKENFLFLKEDVTDLNFGHMIKDYSIDMLIHLAAEKKGGDQDNSYRTLYINSQGTENMLRIALNKRAKFILASTSDVYGNSKKIPFSEDDDLVIGNTNIKRWAYSVSKIYDEQLVYSYYYNYQLPVVILRYFGGFSERSSDSWRGGHIPCFIHSVMNDEPVNIHGTGDQTRSMAYVEDIVKGTYFAAMNDKAVGEIFNIGNDEEISVLESAKIIHQIYCELSGKVQELKINWIPIEKIFGNYKEILRRKPDLKKAAKILDYYPEFSFREGIRKVMQEMIKS